MHLYIQSPLFDSCARIGGDQGWTSGWGVLEPVCPVLEPEGVFVGASSTDNRRKPSKEAYCKKNWLKSGLRKLIG